MQAERELLNAMQDAWNAGHDISTVELEWVAPVLVSSILSELARMTMHQVVEQSREAWLQTHYEQATSPSALRWWQWTLTEAWHVWFNKSNAPLELAPA